MFLNFIRSEFRVIFEAAEAEWFILRISKREIKLVALRV